MTSDNPLPFRCNLLEKIYKLLMTIDDKIRDEKLQCDVNREAAKTSSLSSVQTDMNVLQTKKILPTNQNHIIKKAKFTYSPLGESLEGQTEKLKMQLKTKKKKIIIKAIDDRVEKKNPKRRLKINQQFTFKRFFKK